MAILAMIGAGFAAAFAAPAVVRVHRKAGAVFCAAVPTGIAIALAGRYPAIVSGGVEHERIAWIPSLGFELSFCLDGLSLMFGLLISVVGALVCIYAYGYFGEHPLLGRFYAYLLAFMAAMLGLVFADNLLVMFVFWELTSLTSYLLIGFDHERAESRAAALQALLVTGLGGLGLLVGVLLLGHTVGSFDWSTIVAKADAVRASRMEEAMLVLVLLGAFTKSAQFPFHFWLPGAMAAPTPVSAYLHSATMVKAGIYLLARLSPVFSDGHAWFVILTTLGGITMLFGAWQSIHERDLKRILAYSTVSGLGGIVMLLGIGGADAALAAVVYVVAHAAYKGALFLVAGILDHETGTRDTDRLGGLVHGMPQTASAAIIAALSMMGVPLLAGFLGKELFYDATLHHPWSVGLTVVAVVASMLLFCAAALAGVRPFIGPGRPEFAHVHEPPATMRLGPAVLGAVTILLGLFPATCLGPLVAAATTAIVPGASPPKLALWHGFSVVLVLSVLTLAGGVFVLASRSRLLAVATWWMPLAEYGPAHQYARVMAALNAVASWQTAVLQSGLLHRYLLIILATVIVLVGGALVRQVDLPQMSDVSDVRFYEAGLVLVMVAATGMAVTVTSRLAAIAGLGVVGYCLALVFVLHGAPDVAMTQFLVETLTVILFVGVFYHLPEPRNVSTRFSRLRDATVAVTVGVMMTALVLVANEVQLKPPISDFFMEHGPSEAHGRNIVNVILVDFRALDTFGEITVLAVAAVGVYALMRLRPSTTVPAEACDPSADSPGLQGPIE